MYVHMHAYVCTSTNMCYEGLYVVKPKFESCIGILKLIYIMLDESRLKMLFSCLQIINYLITGASSLFYDLLITSSML